MIPKYGFVGAAYATIISEAFFIAFYAYFTSKYGIKANLFQIIVKPVIASAAMVLVISRIYNIFLGIVLGIISYFVALVLLKVFNHEDKKLIARIIKNS